MKNVGEIFAEACVLAKEGAAPRAVSEYIVDTGHENGFTSIEERGSGSGGSTAIEITFSNGEVIFYDGKEWHHRQP
jgi:hypothetical protein